FSEKIKPYKKAFNKNIYEEILDCYLNNEQFPRLLPQKEPRIAKGLLNYKTKMLISNCIHGNDDVLDNLHNLPYTFKLILCGSQIFQNSRGFKDIINNIKFCGFFANFGNSLTTCNSVDNVPYCHYRFGYYRDSLNLKHKDKKVHLLEELEIYKLIHV